MSTTSIIETLSRFSLLKGFSPGQVWDIVATNKIVQLEPGEILISAGESNNVLYLLINGELGVVLEKDGIEVSIPIPPGECLGEMSLVGGSPTSARAIATQKSRVLIISEEDFWNKLALTRSGAQNLLSMLAQRLQRNNDALIEKVQKQVQYQLMEKELETAGKIQSSIVPEGSGLFPNREEIDAFALIKQAHDVGGDFYDAMVLDDDHLYFAIGDVSGKGIPAAMFMMRTINSLRLISGNRNDFAEVIPALNYWLARDNKDMMFVSLFAGVLEVKTGLLRYVNAGHNPPFISLSGNEFEMMGMAEAPLVGLFDEFEFPVTELQLQSGDSMLLYTDGITEAKNQGDVMFETDRCLEALNNRNYTSAKSLVQHLKTNVETFVDGADQVDDYTLLGIRWRGGS